MGKKFMGLDGTDHFWDRAKAWILDQIKPAVIDKQTVIDTVYPIGSLYWSSKDTDPSTLFGGTWVQIKDRFVLACGDTYTSSGATGGASTVTLSVSNMPSHTHSFTPSGSVSSHSHGLNNHTHSFTPSGRVSSHSHGLNGHTHSFSWSGTTSGMNRNSSGSWGVRVSNSKNDGDGGDRYTPSTSGNVSVNMSSYIRKLNQRPDDGYTASREHWFTMNLSHEHTYSGSSTTGEASGNTTSVQPTFSGSAGTTGEASGNTTSETPTFTGSAGTTGSSGSGTSFSILPPYVVKYCWERTA